MAAAAAIRAFFRRALDTLARMRWRDISNRPKCEIRPTWMRALSCETFLQPALDRTIVALLVHVDEIDDDQAGEIARQLRLRDLAGLIVIDFIDMEENRNNRAVERRLKECLKQDRARIQVGRISHFGLLEMSRQRIRASVLESSTEKCPYCGGSGHVRSVSSLALQVLRALEEQLMKGATHNLIARTRPDVALYVLNQKRAHLRALEERFAITITIAADETVTAPQAFVIDRGEQVHTIEAARALAEQTEAIAAPLEEEDDLEESGAVESEEAEAAAAAAAAAAPETAEGGTRRRRRHGGADATAARRRRSAAHGQAPAREAVAERDERTFSARPKEKRRPMRSSWSRKASRPSRSETTELSHTASGGGGDAAAAAGGAIGRSRSETARRCRHHTTAA